MPLLVLVKKYFNLQIANVFFISLLLSSCIVAKKYQKDKPFIVKNNIEVKGVNFTNDEMIALKTRLSAQLDDSAKVNVIDRYFFKHVYNSPAAFDTVAVLKSAKNMQASMLHLGYYKAKAYYTISDTIERKIPVISFKKNNFPFWIKKENRVKVNYFIEPGKPTLIDTVSYHLKKTVLQQIALQNINNSLLQKDKPVSKAAVLGEINRLVEIFRNNGFYKFTSEELRVRGDTTIEALTNISDDPFEQLRLLTEAQQKKDSPKIKLAVMLNAPTDSSRLNQYYINHVYILSDYIPGDKYNSSNLNTINDSQYIFKYHNQLFNNAFLKRNIFIHQGDLYRQDDYYKTLNSFAKAGIWQSTNIEILDVKDSNSINKIDIVIQLIPAKQFSFEAGVEASYSANSNTNNVTAVTAGNLVGLSGNVSLTNKNLWKEGIKMTTSFRAGVEFNFAADTTNKKNIINSNELGISNSAVIPRFIFLPKLWQKNKHILLPETFSNVSVSFITRINLFNLQATALGFGYNFRNIKKGLWIIKPINIEFSNLYNQSLTFVNTLAAYPFLRYSFNTALVAGSSISYSISQINSLHKNRQHSFKVNVEQSGFPLFIPVRNLNIQANYLKQYLKSDVEYTHSRSWAKSAFVFRAFVGVGVASKKDTTLPFFKQYFAGGSNSMRGWPIRGIGPGSLPLATYGTSTFNDRTGDMKFETNLEYRYNIAQIIPNTLTLRGSIFADIGNVWNLRNSKLNGSLDSTQFKFTNFWKQLGIDAGTGLRLDFNYFVIRFDFGLRFKRPELSYINNGWKIPSIGFDDVLKKVFGRGNELNGVNDDMYRIWRYNNFNFTIGINYPF